MGAWRAILKHMNLHHKMTHVQASKKWENMKKKYKELKSPPEGFKVFPENWPNFQLMDDAMMGRLEGNAPILTVNTSDRYNGDFLPTKPKRKKLSMMINSTVSSLTSGPEIEVSLNGDEDGEVEEAEPEESQELDRIMQEVDNERDMMDSERLVMEREKQVMVRERMVLQRERTVLDREIAAVDRDRASLERERATIEREKAVLERERSMVERDRDEVRRDRMCLEREKARLERLFATKERTVTEEVTEDRSKTKDSDDTERRERFLDLFEKLIENF
ncbi:zinc finger CCCH domain-containing protein 13 isoform X2 [Notolabrus celidotus]|nr:zinc finger CCCH domain-containing protein 13 isoform X2 [Notolabrus celidotus]